MSKPRTGLPSGLRTQIFIRDGHKCRVCGDTANLCIDHIIPKSRGGKDIEDNLQVLCSTCNAVNRNFELTNEEIKGYLELYEQSGIIPRHGKVPVINMLIRRDLRRKGKI